MLEFYITFARKMPEFYMIIARKVYFPNLGECPLLPASPSCLLRLWPIRNLWVSIRHQEKIWILNYSESIAEHSSFDVFRVSENSIISVSVTVPVNANIRAAWVVKAGIKYFHRGTLSARSQRRQPIRRYHWAMHSGFNHQIIVFIVCPFQPTQVDN